jgi:type VI secretion system protein ImpC
MNYEVNFGTLAKRLAANPTPGQKFRLALLGDFSGRANAGLLETGEALASRKPQKIDVDNLDKVIARQKISLTLALGGQDAAVQIPINSIDDFHPDQLVDNLPLFEELLSLRKNLNNRAGFDRAAKQVLSWGGEEPLPPPERRARGAAIATDKKFSDFARLTGRKPSGAGVAAEVDDLVRRIIGPLIEPARDARQEQLVARVDTALSDTMRRVLHDPDFQAAEALWRGVEFLVRRIETGARTEIVLYDVSAEELAADLAATDALEDTGLYGMLAEQPLLDAHQGAISAVIGLYGFELSPPHADLLGRIAQVAAAAGAPFISAIAPDPFKLPLHDQHPLIKDAWAALRKLPATAYLGLTTPRFLLRLPYGKKTEPIDAFAFEEFTRQSGLGGMVWGHAALIPALLLALGWTQQGAKIKLGSIMGVGDIPYFVYTGEDREQIALPCTERLYTERQAIQVNSYGVMPLICLRGRPELRLASFASVAGRPLAGFWGPVDIKPLPPPPPPPPPAAPTPEAAPEPAAEPAPAAEAPAEDVDLDALLAGLTPDTPAAPAAPPEDDLDALLASLNAEAPPPAADETEPDLDALLASLK